MTDKHLSPGNGHAELQAMAEVVHKARWPADRQTAITPFEDEDRNGREYCFRIAAAVLRAAVPAQGVMDCDDIADAIYHAPGLFLSPSDSRKAAEVIIDHGRHIPQTSPAPGCDSGSYSAQEVTAHEALRRIKDICAGDRVPNWKDDWQTTHSRGRILDICDAALLALPSTESGSK